MTVLSVDYGKKKIGLAISDELESFSSPLPRLTVKNRHRLKKDLMFVFKKVKVDKVLFGLPQDDEYKNTEFAKEIIKFVKELKEDLIHDSDLSELIIMFWDENFSSKKAEAGTSRKFKSVKSDSKAAQLFLQEYLDSKDKEKAKFLN